MLWMTAGSTWVKVYFPWLKTGWKIDPYIPLKCPNWNTYNWVKSLIKIEISGPKKYSLRNFDFVKKCLAKSKRNSAVDFLCQWE